MLKKFVVLATITMLGTFTLSAAAEGGPEGRPEGRPSPEERLNRMQKHLDLSDDQVTQIREIHRNGGGREDVAGVLTDDQRTRARNYRKSHEKRKRHSQSGQGPESDSGS